MSTPKTPLELAALATVAVPGLQVSGLRAPQYTDELVSVTGIIDSSGNRWTVTSPHNTIGGLDLEDQDALLSRFKQAHESRLVPFRVPVPVGFARLKDGTRVIVHHDLGGRFMREEDFADPHVLPASLARALAHLHNLPVGMYTGIDLPSYSALDLRERHKAVLAEAANHTVIPANLWKRWEQALNDIALWRFTTVPIHGDLQGTNITIHEGAVRSMSGFTSAHVGDPATDYSWVLAQASDAFLDRFREAYSMTRPESDIHIETRAQLISELALVRWLLHGVHAHDGTIIEQARAMLRDLSSDLGDEPLVETPHSPQDEAATQQSAQQSVPESPQHSADSHASARTAVQAPDEKLVEEATQPFSPFADEETPEQATAATVVLSLDEHGRPRPEASTA